MRVLPGIRPSYFALAATSMLVSGCFLNADAFGSGGATTTSTGTGGVTTTTTPTPTGGTGGSTGGTTSAGGTGGQTHTGGAGGNTVTEGGGGGAGPVAESCRKDPSWNAKQSGVITIHPFGAPQDIQVYCDQVNMGGGWALVYSSVADPQGGSTTAFWKISKNDALSTKPAGGTPTPDKNYYAGNLYLYGTEYRDDIADVNNGVAVGALHAYANGIDTTKMRFLNPVKAADNMSDLLYKAQFSSGWSSFDFDGDDEAGQNNAVYWSNVSQHYAYNMYWGYNLGSDEDNVMAGQNPPDFTDGGIGPHLSLPAFTEINLALNSAGKPQIVPDAIPGIATRLNKITRWARW